MIDLKYGEKCLFSATMCREYDDKSYAAWFTEELDVREGLFLGYRHVFEGIRSSGSSYSGFNFEPDDYDPPTFKVKKTIKVALVSPSEKKNPIYVPLTHLKDRVK